MALRGIIAQTRGSEGSECWTQGHIPSFLLYALTVFQQGSLCLQINKYSSPLVFSLNTAFKFCLSHSFPLSVLSLSLLCLHCVLHSSIVDQVTGLLHHCVTAFPPVFFYSSPHFYCINGVLIGVSNGTCDAKVPVYSTHTHRRCQHLIGINSTLWH